MRVKGVEEERGGGGGGGGGRGGGLRRRASAAVGSGLEEEAPSAAEAGTEAAVVGPLHRLCRPRLVEQISAFRDRLRGGGQPGANARLLSRGLSSGGDWHFLLGDFLWVFCAVFRWFSS